MGILFDLGVAVQRQTLRGLDVVRLVLEPSPGRPSVEEVVAALRTRASVRAAPNHVLRVASHVLMLGATQVQPAPALGPLPTGTGLPGAGVTIGVVDTGIFPDQWFDDRVDFRDPEDVEFPPDNQKDVLPFFTGHGTFVTGIILQHAPGAQVVVRRVVDSHGDVSDATLAEALADMAGVDIINLSMGSQALDHDDAVGLLATANSLFKLWESHPELVVVAPAGNVVGPAGNDGAPAGNGRTSVDVWPGKFDPVVAVAALNQAGTAPASFSNFGDWVDVCSIGENLRSRFLHWTGEVEAPPLDKHGRGKRVSPEGPFTGWATWSGTSFATARVSAAIAAAINPAGGVDGPAAVRQLAAGPAPHAGCGAVVTPPGPAQP
ncbi:MAG: S8 family peptidase [Acidimicrobiales bacterium]